MEALANLFGGLGLFFMGVRGLSGQLSALAGPRMRAAMARGTRGPWSAVALGFLLGLVTQSSNAVTFIAASLRAANVIAPLRLLPMLAWSNLGTAGLVVLTTVDLRIAAVWLLGVVGLAGAFASDGGGRAKPLLAALGGLGLMLLGLTFIKAGAAPLREAQSVAPLLALLGEGWVGVFALGLLAALVVQSSSTVSILAITVKAAGMLSFDQAVVVICAASMGSGLAVWGMGRGLRGVARQPVVFQAWLRASGALFFLGLLALERGSGLPLLIAGVQRLDPEPDTQLALVFVLLQFSAALLVAPLHRPIQRLLDRHVPESPEESAARPHFLQQQALEDAPSALVLVVAEQNRLTARLPPLLDLIRGEAAARPPVDPQASATLEASIAAFIAGILAREPGAEALGDALRLQARLALLIALRETLLEFTAAARGPGEAPPALHGMTESLHFLLEELAALQTPEEAQLLGELAADRGEMMLRLRRQGAEHQQEQIFRLTGLFERSVWLVRRLALLEQKPVLA